MGGKAQGRQAEGLTPREAVPRAYGHHTGLNSGSIIPYQHKISLLRKNTLQMSMLTHTHQFSLRLSLVASAFWPNILRGSDRVKLVLSLV